MTKEKKILLSKIMHQQDLDVNLPQYSSFMMNAYSEYSFIQLALTYYTVCEVNQDTTYQFDFDYKEYLNQIHKILTTSLVSDDSNINMQQENIKNLHQLRNEIIHKMQILTSYTDSFQLYEYLLNRLEYQYKPEANTCDLQQFVNRVFQYMFQDKDKLVINTKIQSIVSQLPVRITKNKFFDILSESLAIYTGSDCQTVEDFAHTLLSCAGIEKPKDYDTEYPDLYETLQTYENLDLSRLDEQQWRLAYDELATVANYLEEQVSYYMQLQELTNYLYAVLLARPYITSNSESLEVSRTLIQKIYKAMDTNCPISSDTDDLLCKLEGVQEVVLEDISAGESILWNIQENNMEFIQAIMQGSIFESLLYIEKLLSSSIFIALDDSKQAKIIADSDYIQKIKVKIFDEFSASFEKHSKSVNRARMSMVLGNVPVFFNSQEEIKDYLVYALEHCNNNAELDATIAIIEQMIAE